MWKEDRLSFTDKPNWDLGVVAHEIAHYVEKKRRGPHPHDAALLRCIEEVLRLILGKYFPEVDIKFERGEWTSFCRL